MLSEPPKETNEPVLTRGQGSAGSMLNEKAVLQNAGKAAITAFLEEHNNFSVLRFSGKVVVFDTRIPIQLAFYALVEHDMQAAPLWDSVTRQFVGLLTVTDFIDILRYYRQQRLNSNSSSGEDDDDQNNGNVYTLQDLATRKIKDVLSDPNLVTHLKHSKFFSACPQTTLKQSCCLLHRQSLDFLPIILPSDRRVLATVTYTNILEHLVTHFREQRRLFDDSIYDLGIGTYNNVVVVSQTSSLEEALSLMQQYQISAIPVVDDDNGRVINVYSRSDITFLHEATDADDAVLNLDMTVGEILAKHRTDVSTPDRLHTCSPQHTLQSIFEYFAHLKFNRLIVTDQDHRCVGVVSARDLVAYFVHDLVDGSNR